MKLYTVGHSNQTIEEFFELIIPQKINCIIDVRSMPYSKHTPQFNQENIKNFLNQREVLYAHFGLEFGARRTDCLKDTEFSKKGKKEIKQQVNFQLGIKTDNFTRGVERLKTALSQDINVCLMCSEANPIDCHRFSFISKYFYELGWNVQHIIRDKDTLQGITIEHAILESEMIMDYVKHGKLREADGQGQKTIFPLDYSTREQRIDAYKLKNLEIGYCPDIDEKELLID